MTASLSWRFDFRLAPSFYFFLLTRALWLASRDLSARAVDDDLISLPKPQPTTLKPSRTNTNQGSRNLTERDLTAVWLAGLYYALQLGKYSLNYLAQEWHIRFTNPW
jgi:hypothetical protein